MISLLVMGMLIRGTKFSSRVNQVVVAIKLAVVAAVIVVGVGYVDHDELDAVHPRLAAGARAQTAVSATCR